MRRAFTLGLLTGSVYFTGTLYWITRVMAVYGDLTPWVAVLVNAALIVYLALFPAIFALSVRRLVIARGPAWLMAAPIVWVATSKKSCISRRSDCRRSRVLSHKF